MQRSAFPFAVLAALLLAAPLAAEEHQSEAKPATDLADVPQFPPDARVTSHKVVLITDESLNPSLVSLEEGQLIAWISYSASESLVVFAREVARDMRCHSLVNFSFVDDELRSAPIRAGEFASFCELKPGRYSYKVERAAPAASGNATADLAGEILVGDPDS